MSAWQKNWTKVVKAAFYWASETFSWEIFFEKRSVLQVSPDCERSTRGHSAKTFWQCRQSCSLNFEKIFWRKNIHFGKKQFFVRLLRDSEQNNWTFGEIFFSRVIKIEIYISREFSRGKNVFFWRE